MDPESSIMPCGKVQSCNMAKSETSMCWVWSTFLFLCTVEARKKHMFDLKGGGVLSLLGLCVKWWGLTLLVWEVCCCWKSRQTKQSWIKRWTCLQSISNSETDVTINLTRFAKFFDKTNDAKAQQTQVGGPQQRLGTEQRLARVCRTGKQWENG